MDLLVKAWQLFWEHSWWNILEEALQGDQGQVIIDHTKTTPMEDIQTTALEPAAPTAANPDVLLPDWGTPQNAYHNTRVLCDLALLPVDVKNIICACIYQESGFYNYLPNGNPVEHRNLNEDGTVSSIDYGICQINDWFHIGEGKDFPSVAYVLDNPQEAVKYMIRMEQAGQLGLWSSYKSGAYRQWLGKNSPMWRLATGYK